jgi:hypothetical protein
MKGSGDFLDNLDKAKGTKERFTSYLSKKLTYKLRVYAAYNREDCSAIMQRALEHEMKDFEIPERAKPFEPRDDAKA